MTYLIALENKKCSCGWEILQDLTGSRLEFKTREEANVYLIDGNYRGEVIEA